MQFCTKINGKLVIKLTNNNWQRDLSHLKVPSLIFSTFSQLFEILVSKDGLYFSHCLQAFLQPTGVPLEVRQLLFTTFVHRFSNGLPNLRHLECSSFKHK